MPVMVKYWNAYKNSENLCNEEVGSYMTLSKMSEICIPKFIVVGKLEFCYAIVLQDPKITFFIYSLINDRQRPCQRIISVHWLRIR